MADTITPFVPLSADEQQALVVQWDRWARECVRRYAPYVRLNDDDVDFQDARTARMALVKAARTFNVALGFSFGTWCTFRVRRELQLWRASRWPRVQTLSLDYPYDSDGNTPADTIPAPDGPDPDIGLDVATVRATFDGLLTEREAEAIVAHLIDGQTIRGVGVTLGISRNRVEQLVRKALGKVRQKFKVPDPVG